MFGSDEWVGSIEKEHDGLKEDVGSDTILCSGGDQAQQEERPGQVQGPVPALPLHPRHQGLREGGEAEVQPPPQYVFHSHLPAPASALPPQSHGTFLGQPADRDNRPASHGDLQALRQVEGVRECVKRGMNKRSEGEGIRERGVTRRLSWRRG